LGEILEVAAPKPLSAEAYQAGQTAAEEVVLKDPKVLAILGDPADWGRWAWYHEWEGTWEIGFYRGIDEFTVSVVDHGEGPTIFEITNTSLLDEEQQEKDNQNRAVEIAWNADDIDEAIYGSGEDIEWFTYVTPMGGSEYGVSFATDDGELFFAHVDIATETVLEDQ
ncbi:MAG: hypothetical protein AAF902_19525, partial [Chloroflexota bacterium]